MQHPDHTAPPDATTRRADALVMFGLTGDLGQSKLFEALQELHAAGRLGIPVVAVGRSEVSDDELRAMFREAVGDDASISDIDLSYLQGDVDEPATFDSIAERLGDAERPVVYAALPPTFFGGLAESLASSSIGDRARLVLEKPIGHDAASARDLWDRIVESIDASRVFLVDHFLAKAAVENLSSFRHANAFVDRSMCADAVASIELRLSETDTLVDRGSFYDGVGVVADVVQNHLLQTLALGLMDRPDDDSVDAHRAARVALLESIVPIDPDHVVMGQYEGYRDHDGVDDDSYMPTYLEATLAIESDRWRGVPVRIVAGKALDRDETVLELTMRTSSAEAPNRLRFELKPDPCIELDLWALDEDPDHGRRAVTARIAAPHDHDLLGDYATLLDDALRGSQQHFAQIDGIVAAWRVVEGLADPSTSLVTYSVGSSGPARAERA